MAKNIVVVESPAKAKTIEKILGADYKVVATYGHLRDLPKSQLGVDLDNNFEPKYIIPRGSAPKIKAMQKSLAQAKQIYLATDFDREGEAIAWHLTQAIPAKPDQKVSRITFTEITSEAIKSAVKNPRQIDENLVDAQQARRVLDRLVGYLLSPVLWKKVRSGLSAGRVQSVALKLIVDREKEIEVFTPEEYWSVTTSLISGNEEFRAELNKISGQKAKIEDEAAAQKITDELKKSSYIVVGTDTKEVRRQPAAPFITSTLQQEAARKLGFSAKKTMIVAQQLYEGIELPEGSVGLISYMRTDSYQLSGEALNSIRKLISERYGSEYLPPQARVFKKKVKGAQEAHEAIRPTDIWRTPEKVQAYLSKDQQRLYLLIWQRTLACQMNDAKFLQIGADIGAGEYNLRSSGRRTVFDGFTKIYQEGRDDDDEEAARILPPLEKGQTLQLNKVLPEQHFTSPPPRYTEASLIKKLEENGIGRPSTYAPIISTLLDRGYATKDGPRLTAEPVGTLVVDLLKDHFPFVVDVKFTAEMEDKLDDVAEGKTPWRPTIEGFYKPFHELLSQTDKIEPKKPPEIVTDEECQICGKPMVIKSGRFGQFMACSGYPECKNTKAIVKTIGVACPEDGGELIQKRTRRGKLFYGCSNYPNCKYATWRKPATAPTKE